MAARAEDLEAAEPVADHLSRSGASELADRIRGYWAAQGHVVDVRIEPAAGGAWSIRSTRVRGFPPPIT